MRTKFNVMKVIIIIERMCLIIITLSTIITIANIILIR